MSKGTKIFAAIALVLAVACLWFFVNKEETPSPIAPTTVETTVDPQTDAVSSDAEALSCPLPDPDDPDQEFSTAAFG